MELYNVNVLWKPVGFSKIKNDCISTEKIDTVINEDK